MSIKSISSTSLSTTYNEDKFKENQKQKNVHQLHPDITYAKILLHILNENKKLPDYYEKIENANDGNFTYKKKPGISLLDYLRRIIKYTKIEFSTLILSMIYIDRICKEKVFLNEFNVHRIMFISIVMAYSYNEDIIFDNEYLALVSGVSLKEMISLEHSFLDLLEFKFYVDEKIFEQYKQFFFMDLVGFEEE